MWLAHRARAPYAVTARGGGLDHRARRRPRPPRAAAAAIIVRDHRARSPCAITVRGCGFGHRAADVGGPPRAAIAFKYRARPRRASAHAAALRRRA
jgi:hypothetical protein